ncbi:TNF receptor-associated factor 3-like isoform X3 [Dendronephthya gigantea]|uniref:TNF receptor-associated factor 3-like isoform X3 n=1 Tax=Dendronephthya gigantea TaxID=151771 RepID=UPI0010695042|nr:TNF receptor-associated factor 3-like isoform X3 [Dendronephthya gigantea]
MATIGNSGHPLKWFKDQNAARNYWECAICLEVLKDPVQIRDCGHQFCELCIEDILKVDPRCPTCRIDISGVKIFEDQAAKRMINQLDVNCCNEGCSWVGCLTSLLQDHQNACKFLIRSADNVNQLDVGKLEKKLETLMMKVFTLEKQEKKHEEDIKELKLKHETELKRVQEKYENDLKQIHLKHDEDVRILQHEILATAHAPSLSKVPLKEAEPAYTWKIANITRKLARAISDNDCGDLESEPFFSSHGYKLKVLVCLNEGPRDRSGYTGIYLTLVKGDRDGTLPWPFTKKTTFILVDQQDDIAQRQNVEHIMVPEGEKEFKRPRQRENKSRGTDEFIKHSTLRSRQYIRDHAVFIKIVVEP